jgi:hypothetical protein
MTHQMIEDNEGCRRILRFLSRGPALVQETAVDGKLLLEGEEHGTIAVDREALVDLIGRGVVARRDDKVRLVAARPAGTQAVVADETASQQRQREFETRVIEVDGVSALATVNLSESPLGQLMRRKTRTGASFLSLAEFEAGERLRSDYTRGQIMPRLGANWVASVASGKRGGGNGIAELTDSALAARQRVDRAITVVGPELSGVLIDVCCFLKGLEQVELERGWPVRSAKIVLKTALGVLSRHYRPQSVTPSPAKGMLHWGSEDYRPVLDR